jgi:acylphosphatase
LPSDAKHATMGGMIRRRIVFEGRVQGVGFRARARLAAQGQPVTGWVRNEPDGTVTLEAQGTHEAVDAYLALRPARSRASNRSRSRTPDPA